MTNAAEQDPQPSGRLDRVLGKLAKLVPVFWQALICGVLLVFATAIALGRLAGADGGSYADWLSATATLAAFAAAIVAARFAAEASRSARATLEIEQTRDELHDALRQRAQADLVAAWLERTSTYEGMQRGQEHLLAQRLHRFWVRNASEIPVTLVGIRLELDVESWPSESGGEPETRTVYVGTEKVPNLPPAGEPREVKLANALVEDLDLALSETQGEMQTTLRVGIGFVDASGRVWYRSPDGSLEKDPS